MGEMNDPFVWLWPYPAKISLLGEAMESPKHLRLSGEAAPDWFEDELRQGTSVEVVSDAQADTVLTLRIDTTLPSEGYRLAIKPASIELTAADHAGLSYGCNSLVQIAHYFKQAASWPVAVIEDAPTLETRAAMVDLGRSIASPRMLKRLIHIFHRLRYNRLHLRLYDDELCGLRFNGLPFGYDNPYAISLVDLKDLVDHAAQLHIEVVPELESWGHVGALTHHRPDLRGGPGVYNGSSFLIGEPTIKLMTQLIDQVVGVLDDKATIHLGFDEANWFPDKYMPVDYSPADLLSRYHDVLMQAGTRHGKKLTLEIYADHAGRTVPTTIRDQIIVQPWQYWITNREMIDRAIKTYGKPDAGPWSMCVGQSLAQYRGAYLATRYFCQHAQRCHNLHGATVCMWGWNDWDRLLITYFAGAQYLWNPTPPTPAGTAEDQESCDRFIYPIMHTWQALFADARPEALAADRGPLVFRGYYHWGPEHGRPVSPSAEAAGTFRGHDFVNEQHLSKPKP